MDQRPGSGGALSVLVRQRFEGYKRQERLVIPASSVSYDYLSHRRLPLKLFLVLMTTLSSELLSL